MLYQIKGKGTKRKASVVVLARVDYEGDLIIKFNGVAVGFFGEDGAFHRFSVDDADQKKLPSSFEYDEDGFVKERS